MRMLSSSAPAGCGSEQAGAHDSSTAPEIFFFSSSMSSRSSSRLDCAFMANRYKYQIMQIQRKTTAMPALAAGSRLQMRGCDESISTVQLSDKDQRCHGQEAACETQSRGFCSHIIMYDELHRYASWDSRAQGTESRRRTLNSR